MGLDELLTSLRANGQKQIDEIWQAAHTEAETLRQQVNEAVAKITKEQKDQLAASCRKATDAIFSAATVKVRGEKLLAYETLEHELREVAGKQLVSLLKQDYEQTFSRLASELPPIQWEKIAVNPDDLKLAERSFAAATIHPNPAICGGLIASSADDKIIVDNTFGKRLERKWPYILPAIFARIETLYEQTASTENTA